MMNPSPDLHRLNTCSIMVAMDSLIKLQEIAVHMDLEPAEEVGRTPAAPAPPTDGRPSTTVAPCGQVIGPQVGRQPPAPTTRRAVAQRQSLGVTRVALPNGRTMPLLKTMMTTACERDCHYCPFRAGRNYRRVTFTPDEMAEPSWTCVAPGWSRGCSSAAASSAAGSDRRTNCSTPSNSCAAVTTFDGYVHLKIMPGAAEDQILRAMQLADRLSINLEGPTPERLSLLAPKKQFVEELLAPLRFIERVRRERPPREGWQGRWPSTATQFVVGAVDESDLEILNVTHFLTREADLKRAYFSAFQPVPDTPLADNPAENPWRQHRLYQASFLFRDYGFDLEEMPFDAAGRLPLDTDPKRAWAQVHLSDTPVEVNRAAREELLRVPGIGPKGAEAILAARRRATLRSVGELRQIGVRTKGIEPFVLLDGRRPEYQLRLFT
jgi:predicted DNA-binding helix-hairpin-helix protein